MEELQQTIADIDLDRQLFSSLFAIGEEVASGDSRERKNAACLGERGRTQSCRGRTMRANTRGSMLRM